MGARRSDWSDRLAFVPVSLWPVWPQSLGIKERVGRCFVSLFEDSAGEHIYLNSIVTSVREFKEISVTWLLKSVIPGRYTLCLNCPRIFGWLYVPDICMSRTFGEISYLWFLKVLMCLGRLLCYFREPYCVCDISGLYQLFVVYLYPVDTCSYCLLLSGLCY